MIKIGSNDILGIYVGASAVTSAYIGSTMFYGGADYSAYYDEGYSVGYPDGLADYFHPNQNPYDETTQPNEYGNWNWGYEDGYNQGQSEKPEPDPEPEPEPEEGE